VRRCPSEGLVVKRTQVVLLHGAWFHTSSWDGWAQRFAAHGFAVRAQSWPERLDDLTLDVLIAYHEEAVRALDTSPVLIGHSVGGLIAQRLLGAGLARAAVALAPLPVNGVPLDNAQTRLWSLLQHEPGEERQGTISLTPAQFRHTVANAVGEDEAARLFERYAAPAPRWLFTDTSVDTANHTRGPLLLVSGQEDRMVPDAATRAAYKLYGDSTAVTDLKQFADRGHSLVVDSGWRAVADHVLAWLAANGIGAVAGHGRLELRRSNARSLHLFAQTAQVHRHCIAGVSAPHSRRRGAPDAAGAGNQAGERCLRRAR